MKSNYSSHLKRAIIYLAVSVFCLVFAIVYEHFSHGVYSMFMMLAFLFPLAGGFAVNLVLHIAGALPRPKVVYQFYGCGLATLTVGSIVKGALDIYGTSNPLVYIYWIFGITLCVFGIFLFILSSVLQTKRRRG